jgi:hypothetical protein
MKLTTAPTLISAYAALATFAIGLLAYGALRTEPKGHVVKKSMSERISGASAERGTGDAATGKPRVAVR